MAEDAAGKGYMGKKDISGKEFFAERRRFAELFNAVIYQKKEVIHAEELEPASGNYPSFSGKGELGRDIFMKDRKQNICYGLELETESDYSMPERIMVYDACEFEKQIKIILKEHGEEQGEKEKFVYRDKKSRIRETEILLPVITVVLYLGTGHWEGKKRLSDLYGISEEMREALRGRLPDYGFSLTEADYLDADGFATDLKEFFQAMQCRSDKRKLKELLKTENFRWLKEDTARAIAVYLDRERLIKKVEAEGFNMCAALDELLKDERMEGKTEGKAEGEKEERITIIRNMIREGLGHDIIQRVTKCSANEFALALTEQGEFV